MVQGRWNVLHSLVLGMVFIKWNLICCIEEVFDNLCQQYDGIVFLRKHSMGAIHKVRFRGWVGGTTKSVFLCTGVGGSRSNSVCTLLKK